VYSVSVSERRYTAAELLEHARAQGTPASDRLIDDWVRKGLIDRPQAPGRGQGGGRARGTWPRAQLQLFLLLLRKRRDEVKRVLTLCNIPVATWMYYGDQYVPLRQVRRALTTWSASYTYVSEAAAKRGARRLVDQLPKTRRAARTELIEVIAKAAYLGKVDRRALVDALAAALDPDQSGRTGGPPGATLTPENYADLVEARLCAATSLEDSPDNIFRRARLAQIRALEAYVQQQPELATDPTLGHIFTPATLEQLTQNACVDLLTTVGFLQLAAKRQPQPA
jgi:hypothetical protein